MVNKKKKTPKVAGAKLALTSEDTLTTSIVIEINGDVYTFNGTSKIQGINEAVEAHIENDREFKDNITVIRKGYINEIVYAPAVLCALGFLDRGDLYELLVGSAFEDYNNED